MEKNWVRIYSSNQQHQINLLKGILKDNEVDSIEINKQDSFYMIGEIELHVQRQDVMKAQYIIEKYNDDIE